jgi:hypothetical protein
MCLCGEHKMQIDFYVLVRMTCAIEKEFLECFSSLFMLVVDVFDSMVNL